MKTHRYEFILEAEQPIAHHEGSYGNHALVMRRKTRLETGELAEVPCITADTMRHGMRTASTYALLDAAGLLDEGNLSQAALRLLFAGGMMTGRGDTGTVNLDQYRELVELVPPLGLFGGCASNRVIPGRLFVDDALLVCEETWRWLPERAREVVGTEVHGSRAYIEDTQRVRMDPMLDPSKRLLLTEGDRAAADRQLSDGEIAHATDDAVGRDETKSTMLPRSFERLIQGSLFTWGIQADTYSDLDHDTLVTALGVFLANPIVGGKRGTGHGKLRVVKAWDVTVARPSESVSVADPAALGGRAGDLFRAHVRERAGRIREFLAKVTA